MFNEWKRGAFAGNVRDWRGEKRARTLGAWGCANVIRKIVWSVGQIGSEEFLSSQGMQNFVNGNIFHDFD